MEVYGDGGMWDEVCGDGGVWGWRYGMEMCDYGGM